MKKIKKTHKYHNPLKINDNNKTLIYFSKNIGHEAVTDV